jgi:hypothetical protein
VGPRQQGTPGRGAEQVGQALGARAGDGGDLAPAGRLDELVVVGVGPVHAVDERSVHQPVGLAPSSDDGGSAGQMVQQGPAARMRQPLRPLGAEHRDGGIGDGGHVRMMIHHGHRMNTPPHPFAAQSPLIVHCGRELQTINHQTGSGSRERTP